MLLQSLRSIGMGVSMISADVRIENTHLWNWYSLE